VYAISGHFSRIVILRVKYKADLLASIERMVKQQRIRNGVILAGIGSMHGYQVHQVSDRTFPSQDTYERNPPAPADLISMNGYIIDGSVHAHITLATPVLRSAISQLILKRVTPLTLDVALAVQAEMESRLMEADRLPKAEVKRARYEAQLAQRRYMQVNPDNRLVADTLEADWNQKLRALAEAQTKSEQQREADSKKLDTGQQAQIRSLAKDFPKLWKDPRTPDRERKRMVRLLLLEDVTLLRDRQIIMHVRFKGGAVRAMRLPLPLRTYERGKTNSAIVAEIDRLLDQHTSAEIAEILSPRQVKIAFRAFRFGVTA
jgi:predicted DNA-binding protein with PD1-like motif